MSKRARQRRRKEQLAYLVRRYPWMPTAIAGIAGSCYALAICIHAMVDQPITAIILGPLMLCLIAIEVLMVKLYFAFERLEKYK